MISGKSARGGFLCLLLTLAAGCRSSSEGEKERKPLLEDKPLAAPPEKPPADPSVEADQTKKEAEALLAAWVRAQNEGDFGSYEKLYAERFTGTKRAGARTTRFDRAGWMKDRKEIFARPFSVTVEEPSVTAGKDSAIVEFTQTFVTPTFRDSGKKRLVLARGEGLRIATEEMLSSSLGGDAPAAAALDPREFAFVTALSRGVGIVLERDMDLTSQSGALQNIPSSRSDQVDRPLKDDEVDAKWRSLLSQTFDLYGSDGRVCSGRVTGFSIWVSIIPHFGTFSSWSERGETVPPAERASTLWNLSERGGRYLVAQLDATGCKDPRWARDASLPAPKLWKSRAPSAEEEKGLMQALRAVPLYKEKQRRFAEAYGKNTPWEEQDEPKKLVVFDDGEGRVYLSATLLGRSGGVCNSPFFEDMWALFKKQRDGFQLVSAGPEAQAYSPETRLEDILAPNLAFDLEGDGVPELLSPSDFFRSVRGGHAAVWNFSPAYFDCPC